MKASIQCHHTWRTVGWVLAAFALALMLSLTGCASRQTHERPASLAARTSVAAIRSKIMTAQGRANEVGRGLREIKTAVEARGGMDKARAILALRQAEQAREHLSTDLEAARTQAEAADAQVDQLVQDNAEISARLAACDREREREAAAKKRWRLIALGCGAAIALFLGLKFGLPTLTTFA